jgi:hypothetical protein
LYTAGIRATIVATRAPGRGYEGRPRRARSRGTIRRGYDCKLVTQIPDQVLETLQSLHDPSRRRIEVLRRLRIGYCVGGGALQTTSPSRGTVRRRRDASDTCLAAVGARRQFVTADLPGTTHGAAAQLGCGRRRVLLRGQSRGTRARWRSRRRNHHGRHIRHGEINGGSVFHVTVLLDR